MIIKMSICSRMLLQVLNKCLCTPIQKPRRFYHHVPFFKLYTKVVGETPSESMVTRLKKKHPTLEILTQDRIDYSLHILSKFNITAAEACANPHILCMNPITMDNYGEILKECQFINITPKNIMRYHTLARNKVIATLKKEGYLNSDLHLEEAILKQFDDWPQANKNTVNFPDDETSIVAVRVSILKRYLNWKLGVTSEEFDKYNRNYLTLKHKPISDIREAIRIAQEDIQFTTHDIRRNGFVISTDPVKTKLILEKVVSIAGLGIVEAIKTEPGLLKNTHKSILEIRNILEEYQIPKDVQQRCLRIYCMSPETVKERLDDLQTYKEYQVLSTNPRALSLVVHQRKMKYRLKKLETAKKQCFSLNHLVASNKIFNSYINNFGDKLCGRDIAILIASTLQSSQDRSYIYERQNLNKIQKILKRHKYWLHVALHVIDSNIKLLKETFHDDTIFRNVYILLYPVTEVQKFVSELQELRSSGKANETSCFMEDYCNIKFDQLTDDQILSLVIYGIEKKYHFSGDGIWAKQVTKEEAQNS